MALLGKSLAVSFPDTILEDKTSLRDKTAKLGLVARAFAIYGVDVVDVFEDKRGHGEPELIRKVLEFLETPQYLRRRLYPLDEALRYAGLLPPLRIPSHKPKIPIEGIRLGDFREGISNRDGTVDIGLDKTPLLEGRVDPDTRVTVKIKSKSPLVAELTTRELAPEYWGYVVRSGSVSDSLSDSRFGLKIATSRLGDPLKERLQSLREAVHRSGGVMMLFGSPSRGLFELVGPGLRTKSDFVVNLFSEQHVETVRTEEAVFAGLNLVSVLAAEKA